VLPYFDPSLPYFSPDVQLLQEQNLELASRLAEMQAFISYKAQSKQTANASIGTWLNRKGQKEIHGSS
jgi:hypothetical protein